MTVRARAKSNADIVHPRGRIWPPLAREMPVWWRIFRALVRLGQGLYYHDIFRAAPAMAFHFFLSLLPLLAFVGYVLGLVARSSGISSVLVLFLHSLPRSTEVMVQNEVSQLATADRLGPLAAVGFFWIASGGVHGLMDSVEMVVGAQPRPWWRKRAFALAWVVLTLVAFVMASYGAIEWDAIISGQVEPRLGFFRSGAERWFTMAFSLAVALAGLSAFYRFAVAHSRSVRRRTLPGAVVAVALWVIVSWGFGIYIQSLTNYTVYYGSLAAVAVLLVWLWLMSLAILVGAELNAQLEGLRDAIKADDSAADSRSG